MARCSVSITRWTAATARERSRGLRQMPMSEVVIREVKVVTSGYAPEFGQTMGLVDNAITPSGTNVFKGQGIMDAAQADGGVSVFHAGGTYLGSETAHRRQRLHVRPRRAHRPRQDALLRRIRTHRPRFVGTERHHHLAGQPDGVGLAEPAYMPRGLNTEFAIGKVDHQINAATGWPCATCCSTTSSRPTSAG